MNKIFKLEDIKAYQIASDLSDYIWEIVLKWSWLAQKTLGAQFISRKRKPWALSPRMKPKADASSDRLSETNRFWPQRPKPRALSPRRFINATDSISGNIAEGFGRFHKKDKVKFYYNSRASAFEAAHWCKKAYKRKLISRKEKDYILSQLRRLPKEINTLIKMTMEKLKF